MSPHVDAVLVGSPRLSARLLGTARPLAPPLPPLGRSRRPVAHASPVAGRGPHDAGQGLVSAVTGVIVFLAFLLFGVHLTISLHATTTVTDTAYGAARAVASADVDHGDPAAVAAVQRRAEADARADLGRYAARVEPFDWSGTDADVVRLRIRADNPSFLIHATGGLGLDTIDREVTVRVERVR